MRQELKLLRRVPISALMILIIILIYSSFMQVAYTIDTKSISTQSSYNVAKKYSIILGTDGAYFREQRENKIVNVPEETKLADDSEDNVIKPIDSLLSSKGFSRVAYFDTLKYINSHSPNADALRNQVLSVIYNAPPQGILIMVGHSDSYKYAPYKFNNKIYDDDLKGDEPFSSAWAQTYSVITISASEVGDHIRSLSKNEMPAFVMVLGCYSMKVDDVGAKTWRWAFRFSNYNGDFPDYWLGRGAVGAKTTLSIPGKDPYTGKYYSVWGEFVKKMINYMINDVSLYYAAQKAYNDVRVLNSIFSFGVEIQWVDEQGYGDDFLNTSPTQELMIAIGDSFLKLDPTPEDQAVEKAITWFNTYFRTTFKDLYNYITENELQKIFITEYEEGVSYDITLSKSPVVVIVSIEFIDNYPVVTGFHIYVDVYEDNSELIKIIEKYKDLDVVSLVESYIKAFMSNQVASSIVLSPTILRNISRINGTGNIFERQLDVDINIYYKNKQLVIVNPNKVDVSSIKIAVTYGWRLVKPYVFSLDVAGLAKIHELNELLKNASLKLEWRIDKQEVARFLANKIGTSSSNIVDKLKEYVGAVPGEGLRPIYYLKHIRLIQSGEFKEYNNVTIAIVFADTGEVYLLNMVVPAWGSSAPVYRNVKVFNILEEQEKQTDNTSQTITTTTTSTVEEQQSSTPTSITSTSSTTPKGGNEEETTGIPVSYAIIGLIIFIAIVVVALKYTKVKS